MINIEKFIYNQLQLDAHVHTFSPEGTYESPIECIHMVDNQIKYDNEVPLMDCFEKHFRKDHLYNLIVGCNGAESVELYNRFKKKIIGFGEVKIYKHYKDVDTGEVKFYKNRENIDTILGIKNCNLPIWIHYDLTKQSAGELEDMLNANKNRTFVLCHCGINECDDQFTSFELARKMQLAHNNLWLDISWTALDYVNERNIGLLDCNRVLVGTDVNVVNKNEAGKALEKFHKLEKLVSQYINLSRLLSSKCG